LVFKKKMLSHIIMKNVIPEDMAGSASVLCRGNLTPENILQNYNDSNLTFDIVKCIELFTYRYHIATIKLNNLVHSFTDEPELIRVLTAPGLTPETLRLCHGRLMRVHTDQMVKKVHGGRLRLQADQMIKKKVQMFHDTAQEWCDAVGEFMQVCDKRAPPLYRCERVY